MMKVTSMRALQALVKASGGAEGVEVEVDGPLEKLGDAPAMCNLLAKLEVDKKWSASGVYKLKPLVPIAAKIQKASQIVCKLLPHYVPHYDIDGYEVICIPSAHAREIRCAFNKLERLAKKLERLGRPLVAIRDDMKLLAETLLELVKCHKGRAVPKHHIAFMEFKLEECKKYCAEAYNMVVVTLGN